MKTEQLLYLELDNPKITMIFFVHVCSRLGLAAAFSACAYQQSADTTEQLRVGLRTGYLSVHMAGGASHRR